MSGIWRRQACTRSRTAPSSQAWWAWTRAPASASSRRAPSGGALRPLPGRVLRRVRRLRPHSQRDALLRRGHERRALRRSLPGHPLVLLLPDRVQARVLDPPPRPGAALRRLHCGVHRARRLLEPRDPEAAERIHAARPRRARPAHAEEHAVTRGLLAGRWEFRRRGRSRRQDHGQRGCAWRALRAAPLGGRCCRGNRCGLRCRGVCRLRFSSAIFTALLSVTSSFFGNVYTGASAAAFAASSSAFAAASDTNTPAVAHPPVATP